MRLGAALALPFACAAAVSAATAEDGSFLFEVLRQPPYRVVWDRLMKDVQPTPDWLIQFNRNFDGVAGPMTSIDIDGRPYRLSFVCKPADCGDRKFEVIFDLNAARAYGALGGRNDSPAFFGAPPQNVQDALAKTFHS
jgi:hypothetical protein